MTKESKRPLSPHLTIYKPQISSMASITHRGTGIFLFLGLLVFCWWVFFEVYGSFECKSKMHEIFSSNVLKLAMFFWIFSIFYHLLNGIRHLFWDMGFGFSIKIMNLTGWVVILTSIILASLSFMLMQTAA